MRFELTTSAVTGRHSNQLNYQAINKNNIFNGGSNRARTCDPLLVRQMLSQLSYTSIKQNVFLSPRTSSCGISRLKGAPPPKAGVACLVTLPRFELGIPP